MAVRPHAGGKWDGMREGGGWDVGLAGDGGGMVKGLTHGKAEAANRRLLAGWTVGGVRRAFR